MHKSTQSTKQITTFDIDNSSILSENEKLKQDQINIINLREELKQEIPSTTYLSHGIHNFYPAKFIPQVPRFVIKKFNLQGKIILDPFAGSGTTAVESLVTGNSNISNDVNPITKFLIGVKTLKLNPEKYSFYLKELHQLEKHIFQTKSRFIPNWSNLDYWYPEEILSSLTKIWGGIFSIEETNSLKSILKASALYISRKYSYGEDDSPKLFKSKYKLIKIKELLKEFRQEGEDLLKGDLSRKAREYLKEVIHFNVLAKGKYREIDSLDDSNGQFLMVVNKSIEELEKMSQETVDCIITSPPYIYAQEYFRSTKIDMFWLNMINDSTLKDLTKKEIGQKFKPIYDFDTELLKNASYRSALSAIKNNSFNFKTKANISRFSAYFNDLLCFVRLSEKLLKKRGILAIFIGEPKVFGHPVNVKDIISEMLVENHFRIKFIFFDLIKSRHLLRNRLNENPNGIEGEWLIIGEKL